MSMPNGEAKLLVLFIMLGLLAFGSTPADAQQPAAPVLKCETGPVSRVFGGTYWIVYSCDDRRSMVVVSGQGNPASPFYFLLTPGAGAYKIEGEGNGDKKASDAAGDAISKLAPEELAALLSATQSMLKSP